MINLALKDKSVRKKLESIILACELISAEQIFSSALS